ncbi:MAG TPA: glycosyltransferase family 39 protein [Phycisphaerae bacterium]|nr:glycosyltransferase family 39 protein [Phycisphaerae bacterium]
MKELAPQAVPSSFLPDFCHPSPKLVLVLCALWLAAACFALLRGPAMGDHEVIVAQIAKQTLQTGDWLVPHYLDTPFLVKPPLAPWMVGAVSTVADGVGSLCRTTPAATPVSALTARLPSVLATLVTILLLYRLGASMFGRSTGFLAAAIFASSLGALLFAFNATAEALLTLFCTWAVAEFWWAATAMTPRGRRRHLFLFYVAFGLAMLAKGPMPLILVGPPLALWWWLHRPIELVVSNGVKSLPAAIRLGASEFLPRLRGALTQLGLWWGFPLFLAMFLPWMILVSRQIPAAWALWNYEYLDRLRGDYPGSETGQYYYYLPLVIGLTVPWALSFPEAVAAPFLRRYAGERRPLLFAWTWVFCGVIITSLMSFKKSYYIVPILPGCALLLAPVIREFFFRVRQASPRRMHAALALILLIWIVVWVVMFFVVGGLYEEVWHGRVAAIAPWCAAAITLAIAAVGLLFIRGRRMAALLGLGGTSVASFVLAWCMVGPAVDNLDDPLALVSRLQTANVPQDAAIYWAGNRPDGRVAFYGNRNLRQVVDPYKLIVEHADVADNDELRMFVAGKICNMLKADETVYIVFQREQIVLLRIFYNPPMHELFSIDRGRPGLDEDDWVVVTNQSGLRDHLAATSDSPSNNRTSPVN